MWVLPTPSLPSGRLVVSDEHWRSALQYSGVWPIRPPSSDAAQRLLGRPAWYVGELQKPGGKRPPPLPLVPFHSGEGEDVRLTYPLGSGFGLISSPVTWRWGTDGHVRLVHLPRLRAAAGPTRSRPESAREGVVRPVAGEAEDASQGPSAGQEKQRLPSARHSKGKQATKTAKQKTAKRKTSDRPWTTWIREKLKGVMPSEKKEWGAECATECWQDSEALSSTEVGASFLEPCDKPAVDIASGGQSAESPAPSAELLAGAATPSSALSASAASGQLSEGQAAEVCRYVRLQAPFAVCRFLAFFGRQADIWMPGTWGRAYNANLVREFDRREQHFQEEEEAIHEECVKAGLRGEACPAVFRHLPPSVALYTLELLTRRVLSCGRSVRRRTTSLRPLFGGSSGRAGRGGHVRPSHLRRPGDSGHTRRHQLRRRALLV